jgi:sulfur-oxidizing protein SoxY
MGMHRRKFIQGAAAGSAAVLGMGLFSQAVMAEWPKAAFEAKNVEDALQALLAQTETTESDDITVKAPDIAENGAVVPIQVTTSLPDVKSIVLVAEKNPVPLVAAFKFGANSVGYVSTRIKMGTTSNVMAVVEAGGKLYMAKKEVKVTIGGCGG